MKLLKIHPADNVAVALAAISAGEELNLGVLSVTAAHDITPGHKVALNAIESGANVVKYGHPIGHATAPIAAGCAVHTHNLATSLSGLLEYEYAPNSTHPAPREAESFQGYRRPDGKVGIRNEVWIVPTVGCINSTAAALERAGQELVRAGIDGLYAFPHPYGCSQLSDDLENTRRAIAGLVRHPNAGAVLVLGLGCENLSITMLQEMLGQYDTRRVKFLSLQDSADEFAEGMDALRELTDYAAAFTREEELRLATISRETVRLCWRAVEGQLFPTAGSSSVRHGHRIERVWRDLSMLHSHAGNGVFLSTLANRELAQAHFAAS